MRSVAVSIRFSLSSMASAMMDRWIVSGVGFAFFYEGLIAVTIFNLASFYSEDKIGWVFMITIAVGGVMLELPPSIK